VLDLLAFATMAKDKASAKKKTPEKSVGRTRGKAEIVDLTGDDTPPETTKAAGSARSTRGGGGSSSSSSSSSKKTAAAAAAAPASAAAPPAVSKKAAAAAAPAATAAPPAVSMDMLPVDRLFAELADIDDPEIIASEGIVKLCELLGIDPQDPKALALMWRLGAVTKPGEISKSEFTTGMSKIRKNNLGDLKRYLPHLDSGFLDKDQYREFYRFCHIFSREGTKKTLEKDIVQALLPILLDANRAPHVASFLEFLEDPSSAEFTHFSIDAWDGFYVFNNSVSPTLEDFDGENSSWPTVLDAYVAFRRGQLGLK
jgi:hypothetical protein